MWVRKSQGITVSRVAVSECSLDGLFLSIGQVMSLPPALPVDEVLFGSVFQHKKLGSDKRMHTKHFTVS